MTFFTFLQVFWWQGWKRLLEKRGKAFKSVNPKLVIGDILGNVFEATFSSKTDFMSISKWHFSLFSKFLNDEVETIFLEIKAKRWKLFISRVCCRKHFRKCFWSYLELKNECFETFEMKFFSFLHILSDEIETIFWKSKAKR